MRRIDLLTLVGALVLALVAGVAVAKPGKGKGGPKKERIVTYVFQGTVTGVTTAATDPTTGLTTARTPSRWT